MKMEVFLEIMSLHYNFQGRFLNFRHFKKIQLLKVQLVNDFKVSVRIDLINLALNFNSQKTNAIILTHYQFHHPFHFLSIMQVLTRMKF